MRRRIVVVFDDSRLVLETVAAALEKSGFDVRTAANLYELDRACKECTPDLFVLDVQTPEAFGDEVAQVLREVRRVEAPMVLFSSLEDEPLAERARAAGLAHYVSKSSGIDALLARIGVLLS